MFVTWLRKQHALSLFTPDDERACDHELLLFINIDSHRLLALASIGAALELAPSLPMRGSACFRGEETLRQLLEAGVVRAPIRLKALRTAERQAGVCGPWDDLWSRN